MGQPLDLFGDTLAQEMFDGFGDACMKGARSVAE